MKYYTYLQSKQWNEYVKSFENWDVYYLCEYAQSFMLHGDGEPYLICYEDDLVRICYVLMKEDIARFEAFDGYLPVGTYFDFQTPYGYGGPLVDGEFTQQSQKQFTKEFSDFCKERGVVSQFIRFHPLLQNHLLFSEVSENIYLRDTIYIDTKSEDIIVDGMMSKNRNMLRKAQKAGIEVVKRSLDEYAEFLRMYDETMQYKSADSYYYFSDRYFEFMKKQLNSNTVVFYALLENEAIAAAVFLYNENNMHYHLASRRTGCENLGAGNLLIYEAANWACENGITRLHLGGGLSENDALFSFKKQFNRNGKIPFYIGRTIFNQADYDYLLRTRKQIDDSFDINNRFLIQYRG